jgi:hypothetical protein
MTKESVELAINKDVQVIREILFGEHLQQIQTRIEALELALSDLKQDLEREAGVREQESQAGHEKLEKVRSNLSGQLKDVKKGLMEQIESEFAAHLELHDSLINELASALMRYRQAESPSNDNQE